MKKYIESIYIVSNDFLAYNWDMFLFKTIYVVLRVNKDIVLLLKVVSEDY